MKQLLQRLAYKGKHRAVGTWRDTYYPWPSGSLTSVRFSLHGSMVTMGQGVKHRGVYTFRLTVLETMWGSELTLPTLVWADGIDDTWPKYNDCITVRTWLPGDA